MITRLHRRGLLSSAMSLVGAAAIGAPMDASAVARLSLVPGDPLNDVPLDFTGFSVETVQLVDPSFYHQDNHSLIALHRRLTPHGVLRIGGNSSEFCWWKATPDQAPPQLRAAGVGRADNWMPQHFRAITPAAVDALRGFLDACGWTCIWGLNFGTGSPEADAAEAAYVAGALGPRLAYFQIGNEPDFYRNPNNRLRPAGWDFPDYLNEWTAIAQAVIARVPGARFGGPDVGGGSEWVARFAREAPARLGGRVVGLSAHYYAEGPPDSPSANIAQLLGDDPRVAANLATGVAAARAAGLAFRMTEVNSCYRGGKPGVSNALASALWGGDYMLRQAAGGGQGVNFHGGPGAQIAASNGDKTPGARGDADLAVARLGAFYSPFAGDLASGFTARPLFHGMMLAQQFAGARMLPSHFDSAGVNASAYVANAGEGWRVALFNKDPDRDLTVRLAMPGKVARLWRLTGPALDATEGVAFEEARLGGEAGIRRDGADLIVNLPRASALSALISR
jgi:hypothetical protein